ncbi:MAG TPA: CDP-diacylglycerol--glycerol-3-phosphate 3-phosphatidyltransferase [Gammaproteobacteria bacterium]|nr:CDP-diacylglycerol--glycerol-3-phosphate 3-phosphatidyltransferase [Gammaproteobacteria bacterium]
MNIPNSLTLIRILLIPVFIVAFYLPAAWSHILATAVFSLAAITDWLDGYIARRLNQTSKLGAFLDPVADKLMIAVVLVLLVQENPTVWLALPAAVIIGREITVSALREWMAELGARGKVAVSMIGKIKTVTQMIALILLVFREPVAGLPVYQIGMVSLYIAALLTLWSMFQYLILAWPELSSRKNRGS